MINIYNFILTTIKSFFGKRETHTIKIENSKNTT
jgi:hypothetical protein